MILFSSINQPLILWFFAYLGFSSGVIFSCVFVISNKIRGKIILKNNVVKQQKEKEKKSKKFLLKNEKKQVKKFNKFLKKMIKKLAKIIRYFFKFFANIFTVFTFLLVVFGSFLINLKFNYGEITVINFFVFCLAFMLSGIFLKMLAKFSLYFYNIIKFRRENK